MLKTGFAKNIITPWRGVPLCGYFNPRPNTGVYDDLTVKAVIMENNGIKSGIVSFDLCYPGDTLMALIMELAAKAGISFIDRILFCATHSHTAPYPSPFFGHDADVEYLKMAAEKTIDAILTAEKNLAETELFSGKTYCDTLAFNRRYWMKNGKVLTNPGKLNPDMVKAEGPVDFDIPILAMKQNGMISALFVNIVNHTDTVGGNVVSADWPGRMERYIQDALGYDVPVITLIGCSGNINHLNQMIPDEQCSFEEAQRIGKGYADIVLKAIPELKTLPADSVKVESSIINIPYCTITEQQCEDARQVLERTKNCVNDGSDMTSEGLATGDGPVAQFFAQQLLAYAETCSGKNRDFKLFSFKFGSEFAIVSIPGEPFTEIGLGIKKASVFPQNMVVSLGMGDCGYVPMPECFERGGYEILPVEGGAPEHQTAIRLQEYAIELLNR